jgi:hypothetical protein
MSEPQIIPRQNEGFSTDTVSKIKLDTVDEALWEFELAKERLLDVSHWHELSGDILAKFQLTDSSGRELSRKAREGDYFRINIPGPGNRAGEGYDWVHIEEIINAEDPSGPSEYVAMKVRPCSSPVNNEPSTAHFFKNIATSTFMVKRINNVISAEVHGRNEKPNMEALSIFDKMRNLIVGLGAMLGFSKVQWKSLVEGLIKMT